MKDVIIKAVDQHAEELISLARNIWETPEMGWKEQKAVAWTAEVLRNSGFDTEVGAYGMPTCIRAVWGSGKPVVGFCAEYDCLPGLSQKLCSTPDPVIKGGDGHGCGHNLLGAGCVGAVIGLKAAMEESGISGTVIFYGCPAEEQLTGKGFMTKNGAFKECDFTLAWHPASVCSDTTGSHTAVEGFNVEFKGVTAHAAADPENGRSALDALQLMNLGVEFLREHVTSDVRIHYTITDGGLAPNIVPDTAAARYFVRALTREAAVDTYKRVIRCAEGAAHMTETTAVIHRTGGLYPTLQNKAICDAVQEARTQIPMNEYTEEELAFADGINRCFPQYQEGVTPPLNLDQTLRTANTFGSTDYGDVEYICPGFQINECTAASLTPGHSWAMTASSGSSFGMKGMIRASKLMALSAYLMMSEPERLESAKKEFLESTGGKEYVCPIDDTIEWPY